MNVGRTPTELYDEMQPDYSASGMHSTLKNFKFIINIIIIYDIYLVYDHGAISIAICRSPNHGSPKFFDRVTEKIEKYKELNVSGRHLRVRYVKERGIEGINCSIYNLSDYG